MVKTRTILQTMLKKDAGPEAFQQYMKIAFPWIETAKKRDQQDAVKFLQEEIKRGPLVITPQNNDRRGRYQSRLKKPANPTPTTPQARSLANRLPSNLPKP